MLTYECYCRFVKLNILNVLWTACSSKEHVTSSQWNETQELTLFLNSPLTPVPTHFLKRHKRLKIANGTQVTLMSDVCGCLKAKLWRNHAMFTSRLCFFSLLKGLKVNTEWMFFSFFFHILHSTLNSRVMLSPWKPTYTQCLWWHGAEHVLLAFFPPPLRAARETVRKLCDGDVWGLEY